jgi:hypothetical protein
MTVFLQPSTALLALEHKNAQFHSITLVVKIEKFNFNYKQLTDNNPHQSFPGTPVRIAAAYRTRKAEKGFALARR